MSGAGEEPHLDGCAVARDEGDAAHDDGLGVWACRLEVDAGDDGADDLGHLGLGERGADAAAEQLRLLDLSPRPNSRLRRLFDERAVEADLARLAGLQQADGGWTVDFETSSPAAALEWRGYATTEAIAILLAHQG